MNARKEINKLGDIIRRQRLLKALSSRELAEQSGVHHTTITMLERAEIDQPRPDKLTKLAEALDLDPTDLLTLAGYQPSGKLPGFGVYLRTTTGLPDQAIEELQGYYEYMQKKYGPSGAGPSSGEDESDESDEP
jgi:transcriptional regulator with XRE-family HTH domain